MNEVSPRRPVSCTQSTQNVVYTLNVHLFRFERGGFSGGGNSRWADEPKDDDWSKPTASNERLEQ